MGASSWSYFVPYQADIRKALMELRAEVFARGDYEAVYIHPPEDAILFDAFDAWYSSWHGDIKPLRQLFDKVPGDPQPEPAPESIDQLLELCGENGTHSIIDMRDVSAEPDFGTVSPLDEEDLGQMFGTIWPTHEMAEAKLNELMDLSDRWVGTYLTLYKEKQPDEILFVGCSGD